jgi:copper chaperone CopZ
MRLVNVTLGAVLLVVVGGIGMRSAAVAATADDTSKTAVCTLKITGMTCGGCAAAVKSAAKKVHGVKDAQVSYEQGRAEVTYDPARTTPDAIAKAVTERSGFTAEIQR